MGSLTGFHARKEGPQGPDPGLSQPALACCLLSSSFVSIRGTFALLAVEACAVAPVTSPPFRLGAGTCAGAAVEVTEKQKVVILKL